MAASISLLVNSAAATQAKTGDLLEVEATGFALTHAATIAITSRRHTVTFNGTTSGGGALTFSDIGQFPLDNEGIVDVTVDDGTDAVSDSIQVFRG